MVTLHLPAKVIETSPKDCCFAARRLTWPEKTDPGLQFVLTPSSKTMRSAMIASVDRRCGQEDIASLQSGGRSDMYRGNGYY